MPMLTRALPGRFHPEALFRPKSVAVLGAQTPAGAQVMRNMLAAGFKGAVLPVGTGLASVSGVLAYPAIADLPLAPDLAVICTPDAEVHQAIRDLAARGTRAGIVMGMQGGLRAVAGETGLRVLGPGSFGLAVPGIGLDATRGHLPLLAGRIALVSQSAALCRAVLDWAEPNGVGFSHIVGVGGNDDIGFGLVMDWLSRDGGTGAILLDIRRLKDARAFLSAARAAARLRPVVALRAGGRLLDPTGAADAVFTAALRRCGVLCVETLEDLLAAAETLSRARPARSEALAIVTNAVGPAQLAADAILRDGLTLAELAPETRTVIQLRLPNAFGPAPSEPQLVAGVAMGDIVYSGTETPVAIGEAAALLAGAREVGGVMAVMAPTGAGDGAGVESIIAASTSIKVPLLVCVMGETTGAVHRRALAKAGVAVFATPAGAVRGFLHLVQDRRNRAAARELPASAVLEVAPDQAAVRGVLGAAQGGLLAQREALLVLAAYGVNGVPSGAARDGAEAAAVAATLGFPVVLKRARADRPDAAARSGVALDLRDGAQVRAAAALLDRRGAGGDGDAGFLVQRQVGRARELRIQAGTDSLFGPVIRFGQGGTAADAWNDVAVDLPPLNLTLARGMIARTRAAATLGALHDLPAANVDAVAETLVRIAQLLIDFPRIAELDLNPLFVDADGVMAADAWIRLRAEGEGARLAIPPFPAELAGIFRSGGRDFVVRPVRPEDAEAHGAFFRRLSPEDVRYRFFSAMRDLSAEQIARLTQVDYTREMAFVAVRDGQTVGVARIVRDTGSDEGEFAIAVQPDTKGSGIGRHLMERLVAWSRAQGMREMVGLVLADNAPMLAFVRKLGFGVTRVAGEPDIVEARLGL